MNPEGIGTYYESILDKEVRKAGGIYYTPPPIVDYMANETLNTFLEKWQSPIRKNGNQKSQSYDCVSVDGLRFRNKR